MAPTESVAGAGSAGAPALGGGIEVQAPAMDPALLVELWRGCGASAWDLDAGEFARILMEIGTAAHYGLKPGEAVTPHQQAVFFHGLRLADLVLARACARGHEHAWQHFISVYREPLARAAIGITGSETLGRDLADQLYAELYGLTTRDGERRCPLASYRGRGSLMGWLRTTLAQRHVDHFRRTHREEPLEEIDAAMPDAAPEAMPGELARLQCALEEALACCAAEERFLMAAYYLDGRTLAEIGRTLGVHEATVSRKLERATREMRRQVLKNLERAGLSRRAAEEALGADPRDLELNLREMLQKSQTDPFNEQAAP